MKKNILFIQGGGDSGYEADAKLAASLQKALGKTYNVHYPRMHVEDSPDFGWCQQIGEGIAAMKGKVILIGHSLGASLLLKYLSENNVEKRISGIFLISTPFWKGEEDWVQGLKLQDGFPEKLPKDVPVFLYHCRDDEEVPFDHFALYRQKLHRATFRELASGGHQLVNDLKIAVKDIESL